MNAIYQQALNTATFAADIACQAPNHNAIPEAVKEAACIAAVKLHHMQESHQPKPPQNTRRKRHPER